MAMDKSAADAFVYAKASGMLARSFVGENARRLFSVHSLPELWSLLFSTSVPPVPEALLARELEKAAQNEFTSEYIKLVSLYSHPAPVLKALIHFYDYDNIKELGAALCMGEKKIPEIVDISPFNFIDYSRWPDISLMTKNSPLAWYNAVPALSDQQKNDYKLDVQYIREVWKAVQKTDSSCRESLMELFGKEFRMENVLWALRVRLYYGMSDEEIKEHLVYAGERRSDRDPLAGEAIKTLSWELDSWDQWRNWKFKSLLNPHEEGAVWTVDPRWISSAWRKYYVETASKLFHRFPFTEAPLVCWFLIKQRELDNIRTASEQIRLNMNSSSAMRLAGVNAGSMEVRNG